MSLIPVCAMIPAETRGCTSGRRKDVRLDKEQHEKQVEVEDTVEECGQNHLNHEKPEKWRIQSSHF